MKQKKQSKYSQFFDQNPVEAVRDVVSDVGKGMLSDAWKQMLAPEQLPSKDTSGDLAEGEYLDLAKLQKKEEQNPNEKRPNIAPAIDYTREVLYGERKIARENTQVLEMKIQEIIVELKRLTKSSKVLEIEFREATIEQRIVNPGKYHVSFFEWLLTIVKTARIKVEDSGAWLSMFQSKKTKRQYWNMFKKHGTTFGLSNERVVATQTG